MSLNAEAAQHRPLPSSPDSGENEAPSSGVGPGRREKAAVIPGTVDLRQEAPFPGGPRRQLSAPCVLTVCRGVAITAPVTCFSEALSVLAEVSRNVPK